MSTGTEKQIRNIIFDMGGVLVALNPSRCIAAFEALGATAVARYVRECRTEDLFYDYEIGLLTPAAFCAAVRRLSGISAPDTAILAAWDTLLEPTTAARREGLRRLRAAGYRLFVLSNTCVNHWQYASQQLIPAAGERIDDYFEQVFLSYELHCRKPSQEIFLTALARASLSADETLFIDDSAPNLAAAAAAGLHTFHERADHSWIDILVPSPQGYSATIGFFDGVHRGHQHIIAQLRADAAAHALGSAIITFAQHPRQVLQKGYIPPLLTTAEEKDHLLRATGVDTVVTLAFTIALSQLSARAFMQLLYDEYRVRRLLIGYDHRFGHARRESLDDYIRIGQEIGMAVIGSDALTIDGTTVSSSVVRRLLTEGQSGAAAALLGRRYGFTGTVVRGRGEGRRIGFPTANIALAAPQLIPRHGVYAVSVRIEGFAETYNGMMNIGCRPTYGGNDETIEVNIFHFDEEIYGRALTVEIIYRLRDEQRFASVAALIRQLEHDRDTILSSPTL